MITEQTEYISEWDFTSHIVKVKRTIWWNDELHNACFTSHIVKVKQEIYQKALENFDNFTSHIVKVKRKIVYYIWFGGESLHPT